MSGLKAAIIGAGSTYTPEIIEGFIERRENLDFQSFYLMDIDPKRLEVVGGLAKRMFASSGFKGEVVLTTDLERSVDGADYVFGQVRAGGMAARISDEKIPLKYGLLGQETTGAGGFMNALRTVPVILKLAAEIEKRAPGAWLVNFSNPSGIIADAVLNHTNVKMLGLCNNAVNMLAAVEKALGHKRYEYDYVGLNHLSWITSVIVDGVDVLTGGDNPLLFAGTSSDANMKNIPDIDFDHELLRAVPGIPCGYLSYYYMREQQIKKALDADKTRGEICAELESGLVEQYKQPSLTIKPPELSKRGGALYSTAAVSVVDAIHNDKREIHVVNVKNNGAVRFMDDDDVVEIRCLVGRDGPQPLPVKTYSPYMAGIMRVVKAYEKLTVSAAMTGSREDALAALMLHPLVGDFAKAKAMLDEMLAANAEYLPAFR